MSPSTRPIRLIQWATGSIGKFNIVTCANNSAFKLVGCWVHSAEKNGCDAGEIAGIGPIGIKATNSIEEILAIEADVVLYAPLLADVDEICRILRSGKNVITPCGFITVRDKSEESKISAACKEGRVSFHGSGIHPGFTGDRLPLALSAMSRRIDSISVYEIVDMSAINQSWQMVEILGFDMTPEAAKKNPPALLGVMSKIFHESIALVAQGLGLEVDEYSKEHEFALTTRDIEVQLELGAKTGVVRKGRVGGQHFSYLGRKGGRTVIDFQTFWKMGKDLNVDWPYDDRWAYHVVIKGDPDMKVTFTCGAPDQHDSAKLGLLCTAMNCMNAAPYVVAAAPGIVTQLDLPLIRAVNAFNA